METWGFAISFATCQPGYTSEYMRVEGALRSQHSMVPYRCALAFIPAAGPAAGIKASAQRYGTIDATSVFYLLTRK